MRVATLQAEDDFDGWRDAARNLAAAGVPPSQLEALRAPAGLDLGAITPDEIALSIVAEMVEVRRRGQRHPEQKQEGNI